MCLLLVREGPGPDSRRQIAPRRSAGNSGNPRRSNRPVLAAHQGVRRHLPRHGPTSRLGFWTARPSTLPLWASTTVRSLIRYLDGEAVSSINSNLTSRGRLTSSPSLTDNLNSIAFQGITKGGPFDIPEEVANAMLPKSPNPSRQEQLPTSSNPGLMARDITDRPRGIWIIDFGVMTCPGKSFAACMRPPLST